MFTLKAKQEYRYDETDDLLDNELDEHDLDDIERAPVQNQNVDQPTKQNDEVATELKQPSLAIKEDLAAPNSRPSAKAGMLDDEISDVDLNDEMGAPKALYLLNIEREEKVKRRKMETEKTLANQEAKKIDEQTPIGIHEPESHPKSNVEVHQDASEYPNQDASIPRVDEKEFISVPLKSQQPISQHRKSEIPASAQNPKMLNMSANQDMSFSEINGQLMDSAGNDTALNTNLTTNYGTSKRTYKNDENPIIE